MASGLYSTGKKQLIFVLPFGNFSIYKNPECASMILDARIIAIDGPV